MRNQKGYVAGYNGQARGHRRPGHRGRDAVPAPGRPHLAAPGAGHLPPAAGPAGIRPKLRTVLADAGYVSEENFARADHDKLRLLAPLAKDPGRAGRAPPQEGQAPGPVSGHRPRHPAAAASPRTRGLQAAGPHRGTGIRAAQDLPETDHDVPARPGSMRKRMAAGLHRAQSAQAAPAPPARLTIQGRPQRPGPAIAPRTTARHLDLHARVPDASVHKDLRDSLKYTVG